MVYCGKPSRGCQMCRTRRIKVLFSALLLISHLAKRISLSHPPQSSATRRHLLPRWATNLPKPLANIPSASVTRQSRHAISVQSQGESAQATRTSSTSSFAMRLKPPSAELARPIGRPSPRSSSSTAPLLRTPLPVPAKPTKPLPTLLWLGKMDPLHQHQGRAMSYQP